MQQENKNKPVIAITMGDPAGVGPELAVQALGEPSILEICVPVVFGDVQILRKVAERIGCPVSFTVLDHAGEALKQVTQPAVLDMPSACTENLVPGVITADTGKAAYCYIEAAIQAALAGHVDGICTGPIHKKALQMAGIPYPGHTEILADQTGTQQYCMMLTSGEITCSLVTTHIGHRDVVDGLSTDRILEVIELTASAMTKILGHKPKLIACGLNPHAGEEGLFGGSEEEVHIAPAVEKAREKGIDIIGPIPPDTAFLPNRRQETDAYICMYHDQGLIPLKMLSFDSAINITLGLPIIRTSVDHGTALDIAWQGKANPNSLFEAIRLAANLFIA